MQTLTFKYTTADGSTSERTLLAMVAPGDNYAGIDVSELEPNEAAEFIALAEKLHGEYLNFLNALQDRYDLRHNYRKFLVERMSEIVRIN